MPEINEQVQETKTNKNKEAIGITQKEYGITSPESKHPIIGTDSLDPCVAVTIYDSENHIAGIAHVDATTDIWSLGHMFQDVSPNYHKDKNISFGVYGGPNDSDELVKRVVNKLKQISVVPQTVETLAGRSIAIDSRSGEILKDIEIPNMGENMSVRLKSAGVGISETPLQRSFDGRKGQQKSQHFEET